MAREQLQSITIDDKSTRDIDDALWIDETSDSWRVSVSIADVAKVVLPGSEEDLRAKEMISTKYFATGNTPMLPHQLSEDGLSLWPGRPKQTLTVEIELAKSDLKEKSFRLYRSRLRSLAKLCYSDIPRIIENKDAGFHKLLNTARHIAWGLLERRRESGAMVFYDLNNGWMTTEEGFLRKIESHDDAVGQIIIQEFMILANARVARWAVENDVPVPFRNHQARSAAPDRVELMRQIQEAVVTPIANLDLVRQRVHMLLEKAEYGVDLLGHYGLNLPAYLHFTSPIRRYPDLVVHRQVRAKLKSEPLPYSRQEVAELTTHINETIRAELKERSEAEKEKAEGRARRVVGNVRQLEGLYMKDFERVMKVLARNEEALPDTFIEAFERRLADNLLSPLCLTICFTEAPETEGWTYLQKKVLAYLAAHPEGAMTLFTLAHQGYKWPMPEFETKQTGPDHAPSFEVKAHAPRVLVAYTPDEQEAQMPAMFNSRPFPFLGDPIRVEHMGAPKKRAEQEAAVLLLAKISKLDAPVFQAPEPPRAPPPPVKQVAKPDLTKDPVSGLMEYCQARGVSPPSFAFEQSGPPHIPTITCTCTFEGITKQATAGKKQDAKKLTAKALLEVLFAT